jgi:UDP-N-acetylglucosamine:LPS N-acetylglucosamine transferase
MGFPVHPKFSAYTGSKHEARAALGIDREPFTVLITSGGVGAGNLRELTIALEQTYPQQQFLVVTGKNTALREELRALDLGPNVHIYGFVQNMEECMAASDIIVSKAGPGTLMEALAMRRPVIVTEAVGMQERGNIDFVLNHELGAFCPTIDRVIPAVAELMEPDIYAATTARLVDAVPNNGAAQIAQLLLEQAQLAPPHLRRRLALPQLDRLRQISKQRLRRLSTPRLRLPAVRMRRERKYTPRTQRSPGVRRFPRWRRTRGP